MRHLRVQPQTFNNAVKNTFNIFCQSAKVHNAVPNFVLAKRQIRKVCEVMFGRTSHFHRALCFSHSL